MKLLLVDDHWLFLEGMKALLEELSEISSVAITDEPETAIKWLGAVDYDLVISDLNMPKTSGVQFLQQLINANSKQKTLVLTIYQNTSIISRVKSLGVNGIITKTAHKEDIIVAIKTIIAGNDYFPSDRKKIIPNFGDDFTTRFSLTTKEQKVLLELLDNKTNIEISEKFNVSNETIKFHRKNIYRKMGVHNVLDLYKLMN